MRFSEHFKIGLAQPELDFVDIPLDEDLGVYLDPFAISLYDDDDLSQRSNDAVVSFFQTTINAIRSGDDGLAQKMLQRLSEPNETHLGVSAGAPQGRGVSGKQAFDLYKSIVASKAAKSGLVSEISECDLFIDGIGPDKISDMTTNIIRRELIEYTQRQCDLHNIPMSNTPSGFIWDEKRSIWREEYAMLPTYLGSKLLLVPKNFVRRSLAMNSQDYLNKHVLEYLQSEHLRAGSALVQVLKNGNMRVTKRSLKEVYPCNKDWMATFSSQHPEVLENYKEIMRTLAVKERKAESDALNGDYDEKVFSLALITSLQNVAPGNASASVFHNLMKGVIEFLFWPNLINPVKEQEIHDGRKRIDLMYTNASESGFFSRSMKAAQISALRIPVECKNYSKDPANPEIDQLSGRFGPTRGWIGFMVYRTTTDYTLLLKRCHDTAADKRGFIIPLGDEQIIEMLQDVADEKRGKIDQILDAILNQIIYYRLT